MRISRFTSPRELSTDGHSKRRAAEAALRRGAALLDAEQKVLLEMILDKGSTLEQVAQLSGLHVSTVSRRFDRLVRKLAGRELGAALAGGRTWTPLETAILREHVLQGTGQRQLARKLGCSRYRIRCTLTRIRRVIAAARKPERVKPNNSSRGD